MDDKNMLEKINRTIENYFPRKADSGFYKLFEIDNNYSAEVLDNGILEPFWDFIDRGGKRWRVLLFCYIYESLTTKSAEKMLSFGILSEIIHNASLMVDDIEDNSDIRRGKLCLHKIYGEDIAINLGNFLYFAPYSILESLKINISSNQLKKIRTLIDREMINIHMGQNFDIVGHRGMIDIGEYSQINYSIMVSNKTGCMIRLALQIAGVLANSDQTTLNKLGKLGTNIATIFQVTDDLLNLIGNEEKYGKEIGGDISEAKITLIIVDSLKKATKQDHHRLIEILSMHTKDQKIIVEAIDMLKKYRSIEYAENYCNKLFLDSQKIIKSIKFKEKPDSINQLLNKLISREK